MRCHAYKKVPTEPFFDEAVINELPDISSQIPLTRQAPSARQAELVKPFYKYENWVRKSHPSLHPYHQIFIFWNLLTIAFIIIDAVVYPFHLCFLGLVDPYLQRLLTRLTTFTWFVYFIDTVMQFFTQIYADDGSGMVEDLPTIAKIYLKRGFLLDAVPLIPWSLLLPERRRPREQEESIAIFDIVVSFLSFSRLVRLSTLPRLTHRWRFSMHVSFRAQTIIDTMLRLGLTIHLITCAWSLTGLWAPMGSGHTWLKDYWYNYNQQDYTANGVYVAALYWTVVSTTGIGYGDIVPSHGNIFEQLVSVVVLAVAATRWSIVIANTVEVLRDWKERQEEYHKTVDACERIILMRNITGELAQKIREYFARSDELQNEKGTRGLVARMSPELQCDVVMEVYGDWIMNIPWFKRMSNTCLVRLILAMENFIYIPKEHIPDLRMTTFVERGLVIFGGRVLRKGCSWGSDIMLDGPLRLRETGIAVTFLATLALSRRSLEVVIRDFPEDVLIVKRVSFWIALRRKIRKAATKVRERNQNLGTVSRASLREAVKDDAKAPLPSLLELGPDSRQVVSIIRDELRNQTGPSMRAIQAEQNEQGIELHRLGTRIDALEKVVDRRFDALDNRVAIVNELLRSAIAANKL